MFPTLYKTSSTGKISEWTISVHQGYDFTYYQVVFGYIDGKKQTTRVDIKDGKNLGRSNETSPYEQACLEARSKWNKQKDKGYVEQIPTKSKCDGIRISPMLAHKFDDYKHKIRWPCYWQCKYDGLKCLSYIQDNKIILQSRQGKLFASIPHINQAIEKILPNNIILDGELYNHNEDFQSLISLIKRDEIHAESHRVEYHIYDLYNKDNPNLKFSERLALLEQFKFVPPLFLVKTNRVDGENKLGECQKFARRNGYEGVMLRNADGLYKMGYRSHDLLKVKEFQDAEFEIVGGFENKGNQSGQCTIVCKTEEGAEFGVKPEGTSEQREWYWKNLNSLIGKKLTVRFFSWTTSKKPVPRFPIGVTIRDYE